MDFGEVLSSAWKIIWKHKILWIFGILASCGSVNGSTANLGNNFQWTVPAPVDDYFFQIERIPEWQIILVIAVVLFVVLLFALLVIFLATLGRIGMIRGTQQADAGIDRLVFGELLSGSMPYFWRVFGLNLLVGLAIVVFFISFFLAMGVFTVVTLGIGALCIIPLLCILVPLIWFGGVIVEQSNIAIVVENVSMLEGLRRGWDVVISNLGPMVAMALLLMVGLGFVAGFIIGLPLFFIMAPVFVGAISGSKDVFGIGFVMAAICFCLYMPVVLLLSGVLKAYISSAWTLTYLRFTKENRLPETVPVLS